MSRWDVIILGAGAAGLMCALSAGQRGLSVLVLEKSNKPGKKILMSGGGRCNFTNLHTTHENFISHNLHFCKSALSRYTPWHFLDLVNQHEIPYHEKELGQLFCDRSSKDILNMLLAECADVEVRIELNVAVNALNLDSGVVVDTEIGSFQAHQLVIATGGLSIPKMGGSDFGYQVAEQLGLTVLPRRAALVPLTFSDQYKDLFSALSGSSVLARVSANGRSFEHQVLFTHRGLSGPAILQISSYWELGDPLVFDMLPGIDALVELEAAKNQTPTLKLVHWLSQHWPKKVAESWLRHECPDIESQPLQSLSKNTLNELVKLIKNWTLKPAGTEGYRTAEVTLGGVSTEHLSSQTMAVKEQPHVYFIGEVVDVTGHLGGHNFQWAWASAHAAAQAFTPA